MITEDKVRDKARNILGLNESLKGAKADVGQLTTFNQLGFPGISDKPDGWYLPDNRNEVALILDPKSRTGWLYNQPVPYFLRVAAR